MSKNKLQRFAELDEFSNVIQPELADFFSGNYSLKGKWAQVYFKNNNPIVLELACGKGEYSVGLAQKYPDKNFIGIDIKGDRLWRASKTAQEKELTNVAFMRIQIESIESFFAIDEISEIWITFPDPQPNKRRIRKRLTSPEFLERYKSFLIPGGIIHLKTDSTLLFEYSLEVLTEKKHDVILKTSDIYGEAIIDDVLNIKTFYEQKFLQKGCKICYLKFRINH